MISEMMLLVEDYNPVGELLYNLFRMKLQEKIIILKSIRDLAEGHH